MTKSPTDIWLHKHFLKLHIIVGAVSTSRSNAWWQFHTKWKPHLGYGSEHKVWSAGWCLGQVRTRAGWPHSHWDCASSSEPVWSEKVEQKQRVHLVSGMFRSLCNPFTRHTKATWLSLAVLFFFLHSKNTNPSPELVGRDLQRGGVREIGAASHLSATYDINPLPWFLH